MNRCKYDTRLTGLRNEIKYDTKKLGYYIPLHNPKTSQYNIKELKKEKGNKYQIIEFTHSLHTVIYPTITHTCYMMTKKSGNRIVIMHVINKM